MLSKRSYRIINSTVFLAAIPFIFWDLYALNRSHWYFNLQNIIGIKILNLPLEEILFFFIIPQSSLLIWVALKKYNSFKELKKDIAHHFKR
jgi:lycopene cyclase domain-containing protein